MKTINLIHVLVFAPLLIYIGLAQTNTKSWAFWLLFGIALLSGLYHLSHYIQKRKQVNLFHLVAVIPLLLYVSLAKKSAPPFAYLLLFALGIVALWYHGRMLFS